MRIGKVKEEYFKTLGTKNSCITTAEKGSPAARLRMPEFFYAGIYA